MDEKWKGKRKYGEKDKTRWGNRLLPKKWLPTQEIDEDLKSVDFHEKDIHKVEIGDTKDSSQFYPQAKIMQWGNETNFSMRLITDVDDNSEYYLDDIDKARWVSSDGNIEADIFQFDIPDKSLNLTKENTENGGLVFDVKFTEKPFSNVVKFSLRSKNLNFFYQPELTDEEAQSTLDKLIANDATAYSHFTLEEVKRRSRPEKILGSYAVYHKTKRNDEYKTGKAFHIYRPHVTDAKGNTEWCSLNINEATNLLTITISQEFLDNAIYPIIVDPDVGYTTIGGSSDAISDDDAYATKGNSGLIANAQYYRPDSYSAYLTGNNKTIGFAGATWDYTTNDVITNSVGSPVTTTADGWRTSTCSDPKALLAENTDYWIGGVVEEIGGGANFDIHYDTGSTRDGHEDGTNSYPTPQTLNGTDQARLYSLYLTYATASLSSSSKSSSSLSSYSEALCDYLYYRILTIDADEVGTDNTGTLGDELAVAVNLSGDWLKTVPLTDGRIEDSNGWDIRFVDPSTETILPHTIEYYDGTTGNFIAWVLLDDISKSTDTPIRIEYGNEFVGKDPSQPTVVFGDDVGVWFLDENGDGTTGEFKDQTSNSNDGTGSPAPTRVTGKIHYGQEFDGVSEEIIVPDDSSLNITGDVITFFAWVYLTARPADGGWMNVINKWDRYGADTSYYNIYLWGETATVTELYSNFQIGGVSVDNTFSTTNIPLNAWTHLEVVYDGSNIYHYVNGVADGSVAQTGNINDSAGHHLYFGDEQDESFEGILDQVYIAAHDHDADAVRTTYNNQNAPTVGGFFVSLGPEEQCSSSSSSYSSSVSSSSSSSSTSSSSSSSSSSVSSSSYSCALTDLTDPKYWTPVKGSWDGSEWDSDVTTYDIDLTAKAPWFDGFRPDFISLTFTISGVAVAFTLYDENSNIIATGIITSGQQIPISYTEPYDIDRLLFVVAPPTPGSSGSIQAIEFCGGTLGSSSSSSSLSSSSSSSSSRSSSISSSSSSLSSSSRSSSSSSSLSSSATPCTVVWGHHTNVDEGCDLNFTGNTIGWNIDGTAGNDNEVIDTTTCNDIITFDSHYLGAFTAVIRIDKYQTGSGPAPVIQYRTATTNGGLSIATWFTYDGVSFVSLGWIQIRLIHV